MARKRILITGGAGFIGIHLASALAVSLDNQVILVDNLQRGAMDDEFKALLKAPNVEFICRDLTDSESVMSLSDYLPGQIDEVYHLAAVNGTKHFYAAPHKVLRTNTLSTINVLEWITHLTPKPKLLFTSSNEAYAGALAAFGKLPIPTPEAVPLVISDPYNPRWSYAGSKIIGEQFVIHYASHYKIPSVIVRPHNFYGPRAGYDHVIPEIIGRIARREDPFIVRGSTETRSFCYIDDAVDAMIRLMACASVEAPTVHIGSKEETVIAWLVDELLEIAQWQPSTIEYGSSPAGSVARRLANVELVEKMTGWAASTPRLVGLRRTYDWYIAHPKPAAP